MGQWLSPFLAWQLLSHRPTSVGLATTHERTQLNRESSSSTQLVSIDPATLLVDLNIRCDVRLDKDFVASIKELGVLVPVTAVQTSSGELRVRFGHRRTLAAIEAGLDAVPVD